jgi:hypothetical protein
MQLDLTNISMEEEFKVGQAWKTIIRFVQLSNTDRLYNMEGNKLRDGQIKQQQRLAIMGDHSLSKVAGY